MSNILDKVINIAVIGGIGLLAYEYFQCKAKNKEFISCLFGDLGKVGGDFTGGMIDNRINYGRGIAGSISCALLGKKLSDDSPLFGKNRRVIKC